jgi:predicted transcriptional regulator
MKVQTLADLEAEMRAVARGEKPAPVDAALPSVESAGALLRLLTAENRRLLRTIRDKRPRSIAQLAKLTNRAGPNLLRTLSKLASVGLIELKTVNRRKMPVSTVTKLRIEIDPYDMSDQIEVWPLHASSGHVYVDTRRAERHNMPSQNPIGDELDIYLPLLFGRGITTYSVTPLWNIASGFASSPTIHLNAITPECDLLLDFSIGKQRSGSNLDHPRLFNIPADQGLAVGAAIIHLHGPMSLNALNIRMPLGQSHLCQLSRAYETDPGPRNPIAAAHAPTVSGGFDWEKLLTQDRKKSQFDLLGQSWSTEFADFLKETQ